VADIEGIQRRSIYGDEFWAEIVGAAQTLGDDWCGANTIAICDDECVYGVLGWHEIAEGVKEAFACVDVRAKERPFLFVRDSRKAIDYRCSIEDIKEIQMDVDPEDPEAQAYSESLGFEFRRMKDKRRLMVRVE
jgi:hypothetical protein